MRRGTLAAFKRVPRLKEPLRHDQHDGSVAEVEPIGPPEQLIPSRARTGLFAAIQRRSENWVISILIGTRLSAEDKRAHLIDIGRAHLIDTILEPEILPPDGRP